MSKSISRGRRVKKEGNKGSPEGPEGGEMIVKRYIELENYYFVDKPRKEHSTWIAMLMCWIVRVIKPKNQKEYRKRKRWIHSIETPTKNMMEIEIVKFSRRKDVRLLK